MAIDLGRSTHCFPPRTGLRHASRRDKFLFWYLTEYCVRADDVPAIRQRISLALDAHPAGLRSGQRAFASYKRRLYAYSLIDRIKRRFF